MSKYRRARITGATYFFTVVTWKRRRWFDDASQVERLKASFRYAMVRRPFKLDAIVVLPDHLHCMWTLKDDSDFSTRWQMIKTHFSRSVQTRIGSKGAKQVWQPRFWEHVIRDEQDYHRHLDYIHYNPVKHGLVTQPEKWPHSSFLRFIDKGYYELGWGWELPGGLISVGNE